MKDSCGAGQEDKILLAFSGGVDSVVLATLLKEGGYNFALAHCNFSLREEESDGDEDFARSFAQKLSVPFFTTRFDTARYAKEHKLSIQVAARQLRYNWFYELLDKENYTLLATAHHQTDQVETILLNMLRGTGLAGLQGMKAREKQLIRPLLMATRADIETFATAKKLKWREDSSNRLNKYSRNKLRNVVLPVLKGINTQYEENFSHLSHLVGEYRGLLADTIEANTREMTSREGEVLKINRHRLAGLKYPHLYLYELLKEYHFTNDVIGQMAQSLSGQSGTLFYSQDAEALIDRDYIIVRHTSAAHQEGALWLDTEAEKFTFAGKTYTVSRATSEGYDIQKDPAIAQLDADKLEFPLQVRAWQQGDYFYPLGMKKKKKVSDFFTDQKIPVFEKTVCPLIFSGEKLVCIAGLRVDDRFKVTDKTRNILIIA